MVLSTQDYNTRNILEKKEERSKNKKKNLGEQRQISGELPRYKNI